MADSISFNGSSQYAQVGAGIINPTTDYTIEMYIKLNAEISAGIFEIAHFENNTQKHAVYMNYEFNGGTRRLLFKKDRWVIEGTNSIYNNTLGTTNWTHVAMVLTGTTIKCYVNGVNVGTDGTSVVNTAGNTTTNTQLVVGAGTTVGTSSFKNYANTKVACLRIWSDARTTAEINDNKNTVITGTANNLVGSWYNGDSDHNDDSQSNNLTASGSPSFSSDFPFVVISSGSSGGSFLLNFV